MKKLGYASRKWWFFLILVLANAMLLAFASRNFGMANQSDIIFTTLRNAFQTTLGDWNILFQSLSLVMVALLVLFRNKARRIFNIYVAVSYIAFAFIQNMAVTEKYGFSFVTVNVAMFLFVAYVWVMEVFRPESDYSFSGFKWKYTWMILFSLFAWFCPLTQGADGTGVGIELNPLQFFTRNSATAFCLMTPMFLTIMTLNIPRINIVTYRITAIIGVIIGLYNMLTFLNPHTVYIGITHIPLLTISLYATIVSYRIDRCGKLPCDTDTCQDIYSRI